MKTTMPATAMPVDTEACLLLAETIGILLGELADEPATIPHAHLIIKEAEYLCKKAWTTASIASRMAVRYGGVCARAARGGTAQRTKAAPRPGARKRKAAGLTEDGRPLKKKPHSGSGGGRKKEPVVPAADKKAKKPQPEARKPRPSGGGGGCSKALCPRRPASQTTTVRRKPRQGSGQSAGGGKTTLSTTMTMATTTTTVTTSTEDPPTPAGVGAEGDGAGGGGWRRGVTDAEVMRRELEKVPYFRDPSFKASFHMERSTFQALCEVVGFKVAGRTVSPYSKLLGVLWWLAGRESMKQIVRRFDWSIGTFHGAVHLFSTAIVEHLMPQTIRWPSLEPEVKRCLLDFQHSYNFQGVMGCLGACRLPLRLRSAKRGAPYRDPNGRPSILLQAVCDANRRFLHVSAGWPGTTAEHAAFHESDLPGLLDKLPEYAQVLASGDYPARSHVWVPFCAGGGGALTEEMLYFNGLHAGGMAALDRTQRLLKNTWQRLELLEMLPDRIPSVVLAACALLNFILQREQVVGDDRFPVLSGSGFDPTTPADSGGTSSGKKKKPLTL